MSAFGTEGLDPSRVFNEEYWGEIHPEAPRLRTGHIRRGERKAARSLLATLVPKIVSGELTGLEFVVGRFNPTDPDLARVSAFNMPGTVLITDRERLRPLSSLSRKELQDPWRPGDPRDQSTSTRHVLRTKRLVNSSAIEFGKGKIIYANDTHEYERSVSINLLMPNTQGTSTPRDLLLLKLYDEAIYGPTRTPRPLMLLTGSTDLTSDVQIGESYDQTVLDAPGHYRYLGFNRLTSLEVCMQGAPAEERTFAFSKALGYVAHGSS